MEATGGTSNAEIANCGQYGGSRDRIATQREASSIIEHRDDDREINVTHHAIPENANA
jgi:hypothetical protein